jgi:hypothetical protein
MKTRNLIALLSLSLVGCAAQAVGGTGGDDTGMNPGTGSGDPVPPAEVPLSPQGKYSLTSDFNIASNMPGTVGDVMNAFIDATDSPDDPTRYIVDKLCAQLSGTAQSICSGASAGLAGYLNDRLLDIAPQFVTEIIDVGNKFGQVAKNFGTLETLEVDASGATTHTMTGVHFKIDTTELDFSFADYNMTNTVVSGITTSVDSLGTLTISAHQMPISYGKMLRLALDQMIIPMIDPSASDLNDLFTNAVDCASIGEDVYDYLGILSASTFQSACTAGLSAASGFIYSEISKIDGSALQFGINGTAKGLDTNADGKMDKILTGKWGGTLSYAGTPAPLSTATFFGASM